MRVLLVSANAASTPYAVYPLGMSMVAAALRDAGHEVRQCDLIESNISMDAIADTIRQFKPETIGVSIRNIDNVNLLNEKTYIEGAAPESMVMEKLQEALAGAGE